LDRTKKSGLVSKTKANKKVTTVREHPLRVPVSEKNPVGITIRDRHRRRLPGTYLKREEIGEVFRNYKKKGIRYPTSGKIPEHKSADKYDGTGGTTGSITGTSALTMAAGGTAQNISLNPSTTGSVLVGGSAPTLSSAGNLTVKAAGGNTTTIGDSGTAGSATVIQGGSTGKVKVGSSGVAFSNMGVCTVSAFTLSTTTSSRTCTGVPASTFVAITCTGSAAFTTPNTTTLYARVTGANTISMNTTVANSVSMSYTCLWMQP
jgi:hypothetical protein